RLELRPWAPSHQRRLAELGLVAMGSVASARADQDGRFAIRATALGSYALFVVPNEGPEVALRFQPLLEDQEAGTIDLPVAERLEVAVRGADGAPVEGALVVVDPERPRVRGGDRFPPWTQRQSARTDSQGRAALAVAGGLDRAVHVVADGHLRHAERTGASWLEVRLAAGPAAVVEVRDAAGRPVVGAVVREGDDLIPLTVTDERGRASVPAGARPREVQVESADLGYASVEIPPAAAVAAAERPPVVAATLEPAETVYGTVVDRGTGDPIGGALLWSPRRAEDWAVTSPEGRFALTTWSDRSGVPLMAAAAGFTSQRASVSFSELGTTEPTIALEPAGVVSGVVTDRDGVPVPGVELVAGTRERGAQAPTVGTLSRNDGSYHLTGLRHGHELDLRAKHPEYAPLWVDLPVLSPERPTATLDLELDPGLVARGVVVDDAERPVEGARGVLWPRPPADLPPWRLQTWRQFETAEATSDAEGRFRFTRVPAGAYDLEVERDGYAPTEVPGIQLGSEDGPHSNGPVEIGTVVLVPGAEVAGRVVDAEGRPVHGATVASSRIVRRFGMPVAPGESVRTGADGRFLLSDLVPGEIVQLEVAHPDHSLREPVAIRPPAEEPVTIILHPVTKLTGRVLGANGEPIRGATIHASWAEGASGSRSTGTQVGQDGRFELRVDHQGGLEVTATGPGHRPQSRSVEAGQQAGKELLFQLEPGASLVGTVRGLRGEPVVEALVRPELHQHEVAGGQSTARADGAGSFRLDGLAPGPLKLDVRHRDYLQHQREIELTVGENHVDIELDAGLSIEGVVIDGGGAPVEGAAIGVEGGSGTWYGAGGPLRTDLDGRFEVRGLEPASYRVTANAGERGSGRSDLIELREAPVRGVVVRLEPGAVLPGIVTGVAFDDLPRVEVMARPMGPGLGGRFHARPDFEGRFTIDGLPGAKVMLQAIRETDGRIVTEEVTLEAGRRHDEVILDFGAGATLSGVVLEGGAPAPGAEIVVIGGEAGQQRTFADQAGRFVLGVPEGTIEIAASRGEAMAMERLEIRGDTELELDLERAAIVGMVVDRETGAPIADAEVSAQHVRPPGATGVARLQPGRTGPNGSFRLPVLTGRHVVRAQAKGYATASEHDVEVFPGDEVAVRLELAPGVLLVLEVRGPEGEIPRDVHALAFAPGKAGQESILGSATGSAGRVELDTLRPGAVVVSVRAEGYAAKTLELVFPGPPVHQVVLDRGGTLRLLVPDLEPGARGVVSVFLPTARPDVPVGSAPLDGEVTVIPSLPAGPVRIRVQAAGGGAFEASATIARGETVEAVAVPAAEEAPR
ncbi:MAG TPA: carboxypeptidase-like regulatory domain-containing protein, partial [Thermoanaerobaculia bacterium]|nr:carboxypeptidase-like regulatory domain-containing protein [Thermoanaerobaculia bacterium]